MEGKSWNKKERGRGGGRISGKIDGWIGTCF